MKKWTGLFLIALALLFILSNLRTKNTKQDNTSTEEAVEPKYEYGIIYNDKSLNIKWPNKKMIVSKKDKNLLTFKEFKKKFKGI